MSAVPFLGSHAVFLAASCLDEVHLAGVFFDPVVSLVFLVCEHRRGSVFSNAGGDGEAAGSGADDDNVVDSTGGIHRGIIVVAEWRMIS